MRAFLIGVLSLFWHSPAFPSCPAFQTPESSCCPVVPTIAMVTATLDNATPTVHGTVAPKHSETILKRSVESAAHEWRGAIHHEGRWFKDSQGRTLLLRGVNLCGSSKLPTSPYAGWTHLYDEKLFWDHRNVSFVGRPFPLDEAREHFARLRAWGLTLVRLLVPWESIEHKGPGEYDEEYIDYLRELISMMPEYGLKCFIDPHQDTWSRFSGGSGAPGWTFEVAGMDIRNFKETGAAYVHNTNAVPGDPLPMVIAKNDSRSSSPGKRYPRLCVMLKLRRIRCGLQIIQNWRAVQCLRYSLAVIHLHPNIDTTDNLSSNSSVSRLSMPLRTWLNV